MIKILNNKLFFVVTCILFRVILDLSYVFFVAQQFSYRGYILDVDQVNYFSSWLLYLPCIFLVRHILFVISDYFLVTFLLALIAPMTSLAGLGNYSFFPLIITITVFFLFRLFQYGGPLSQLIPTPSIPNFRNGRKFSLIIATFAVVFLVFWYFASGAVVHFNLNFSKVYEFRRQSAELANVGVLAYLNSWVYNVFTIFLISWSLYKKNYILFFVLFIVQIFFYGVSNHKTVFFTPIMIFAVWFYFRKLKSLAIMPLGFIIVVALSLVAYLCFGNDMVPSMFIRRVFYVPSLLTFQYFEFFSSNPHVYWSNSILAGIVTSPYDESVAIIIGQFNGSGAYANNGFISSGYANAGLFGVFIYTFILSYFLKIIDSSVIKSDTPIWLAVCMVLVPLRSTLISSDLFTTALTHGLLISILMLLLFRDSRVLLVKMPGK